MDALFYRLIYFIVLIKDLELLEKIKKATPFLLLGGIAVAGVRPVFNYIITDFNLWMGIALTPFILYIRKPVRHSYKFGILAALALLTYFFVPVLTIYYIAFCFSICFIVECTLGKLNHAIFLIIMLLGSITRYFMGIFSFAIRLKLSSYSGHMLNMIGYNNEVNGNIITHGDMSFSVDHGCMGLKLVISSFFIMLVILSFFEKRTNIRLSFFGLLLISGITGVLVVFTNLLRIMALVILKAAPETFAHETIGLLGLVLYTVLPLYLLTPFVLNFFGKKVDMYKTGIRIPLKYTALLSFPLIAGLLFFNFSYEKKIPVAPEELQKLNIAGYTKETVNEHVIKFSNATALVYIKPPALFYGSDHNPYICWQGSGYEFKNILVEKSGENELYTAILEKDEEKLYTAWWFDNGLDKTIHQSEWRWNSLTGSRAYCLVNVTCSNKDSLMSEVEKMMKVMSKTVKNTKNELNIGS